MGKGNGVQQRPDNRGQGLDIRHHGNQIGNHGKHHNGHQHGLGGLGIVHQCPQNDGHGQGHKNSQEHLQSYQQVTACGHIDPKLGHNIVHGLRLPHHFPQGGIPNGLGQHGGQVSGKAQHVHHRIQQCYNGCRQHFRQNHRQTGYGCRQQSFQGLVNFLGGNGTNDHLGGVYYQHEHHNGNQHVLHGQKTHQGGTVDLGTFVTHHRDFLRSKGLHGFGSLFLGHTGLLHQSLGENGANGLKPPGKRIPGTADHGDIFQHADGFHLCRIGSMKQPIRKALRQNNQGGKLQPGHGGCPILPGDLHRIHLIAQDFQLLDETPGQIRVVLVADMQGAAFLGSILHHVAENLPDHKHHTGGNHQHDHKLRGEQFPQLFFQQTNELHAAAPPFQILPPDLPHHTGSSAPPAFR